MSNNYHYSPHLSALRIWKRDGEADLLPIPEAISVMVRHYPGQTRNILLKRLLEGEALAAPLFWFELWAPKAHLLPKGE